MVGQSFSSSSSRRTCENNNYYNLFCGHFVVSESLMIINGLTGPGNATTLRPYRWYGWDPKANVFTLKPSTNRPSPYSPLLTIFSTFQKLRPAYSRLKNWTSIWLKSLKTFTNLFDSRRRPNNWCSQPILPRVCPWKYWVMPDGCDRCWPTWLVMRLSSRPKAQ